MITISVKIAKEDKVIMIRLLESIKGYSFDIGDINRIIVYETYLDILSKLRISQYNSKSIRLNLTQVQGFLSFVNNVYALVGDYEKANALILSEKINKEITKKALSLYF